MKITTMFKSHSSNVAWNAELQTVFLVRRRNTNVIDEGWTVVPMPDESCLDRTCDSAKTRGPGSCKAYLTVVRVGSYAATSIEILRRLI
jgi:hypothetical protein